MEQIFQRIEEAFNSGDKEVRTWFLVRQSYLPFILCGFYALFSTIIGPAIMKNRKPFDLRIPMVIFNFSIVATYVIGLCMVYWYLPQVPFEKFCKRGAVKKGDVTYTLIRTGWAIYLLKYIELFDTVFFVLRKKQKSITFLHVLHHTIVPLLGWMLLRTETSGFQSIPVIINSVVHVIMYTYYGLAAVGPNMKKYLWWKKYLTQLQMVQFMLVILFVTVITPLSGCNMVHTSYVIDIFVAPLFLYLFYSFYQSTFQQSKESHSSNGVAKTEQFEFSNHNVK